MNSAVVTRMTFSEKLASLELYKSLKARTSLDPNRLGPANHDHQCAVQIRLQGVPLLLLGTVPTLQAVALVPVSRRPGPPVPWRPAPEGPPRRRRSLGQDQTNPSPVNQ